MYKIIAIGSELKENVTGMLQDFNRKLSILLKPPIGRTRRKTDASLPFNQSSIPLTKLVFVSFVVFATFEETNQKPQ
ncbi:MAG TPA: hypothetical protein VKA27_04420 [Sunxiuqinia sp.]|nr:hypothetical protein [Sunxiuqinia sp.]